MHNVNFYQGAVAGKSHIKKNIPCQDKVKSSNANGVHAIALSDGCSTAVLSEYGASIIVDELCNILCDDFDSLYNSGVQGIKEKLYLKLKDRFDRILRDNRTRIREYIGTDELNSKYDNIKGSPYENKWKELFDYSWFNATIQFVAMKNNKCIAGRLGDGFICAIHDGKLDLITREYKGVEEKNATRYLYNLIVEREMHLDETSWLTMDIVLIDDTQDYSMFFISSDGLDRMLEEDFEYSRFVTFDEGYIANIIDVHNHVKNGEDDSIEYLLLDYQKDTAIKGLTDDLSMIVMCDDVVKLDYKIFNNYAGSSTIPIKSEYVPVDLQIQDIPSKNDVNDKSNEIKEKTINKKQIIDNKMGISIDHRDIIEYIQNYEDDEDFINKVARVLYCKNDSNTIEEASKKANEDISSDDIIYIDELDLLKIQEYYNIVSKKHKEQNE